MDIPSFIAETKYSTEKQVLQNECATTIFFRKPLNASVSFRTKQTRKRNAVPLPSLLSRRVFVSLQFAECSWQYSTTKPPTSFFYYDALYLFLLVGKKQDKRSTTLQGVSKTTEVLGTLAYRCRTRNFDNKTSPFTDATEHTKFDALCKSDKAKGQ